MEHDFSPIVDGVVNASKFDKLPSTQIYTSSQPTNRKTYACNFMKTEPACGVLGI